MASLLERVLGGLFTSLSAFHLLSWLLPLSPTGQLYITSTFQAAKCDGHLFSAHGLDRAAAEGPLLNTLQTVCSLLLSPSMTPHWSQDPDLNPAHGRPARFHPGPHRPLSPSSRLGSTRGGGVSSQAVTQPPCRLPLAHPSLSLLPCPKCGSLITCSRHTLCLPWEQPRCLDPSCLWTVSCHGQRPRLLCPPQPPAPSPLNERTQTPTGWSPLWKGSGGDLWHRECLCLMDPAILSSPFTHRHPELGPPGLELSHAPPFPLWCEATCGSGSPSGRHLCL